MKICIINNLFPPVVQGGTEVVVQTTIDLLRQHGHDVTLITTQPQKTKERFTVDTSQGFPMYRFRPRNLYYYTEGARQHVWKKLLWHAIDVANPFDKATLKAILTEVRPDMVHGHNLKGMSYTLPNLCVQLGIPYLHTLHNYQLLHPYGTFTYTEHPPFFRPRILAQLYHFLNRLQFRHVQSVISPSTLPLELHQKVGFFRTSQKSILPSPVVQTASTKEFTPQSKVRFVYFGALEEIKGIRTLIHAACALPQEGFTLDIYGSGALSQELQEQTKNFPHIRWLGHTKKKEMLAEYDALLYPSLCYETQGLAMIEALAQGTPVIAANIGSIPETIVDGKNGALFTCGNEQALTDLLLSFLSAPERLHNMRKEARLSAERFQPGPYYIQLESLYTATIAENRRSR